MSHTLRPRNELRGLQGLAHGSSSPQHRLAYVHNVQGGGPNNLRSQERIFVVTKYTFGLEKYLCGHKVSTNETFYAPRTITVDHSDQDPLHT